jgi:transcription initiation factor IIF auxiliary subunit
MIYVNQLPQEEQTAILAKIEKVLISDGIYSQDEILDALEDALCSKLGDVLYLL